MPHLFVGLLRALFAPKPPTRPGHDHECLALEALEQRSLPSVSTPVLPHLPTDVLADLRQLRTAVDQYEQRVDELVAAMINHPKLVGHVTEDLNAISLQTIRLQHRIDALTGDLALDNRLTPVVHADVARIGGVADQFAAQVDQDKSNILGNLRTHTNARPDMRLLGRSVDLFDVSMDDMLRSTILGVPVAGSALT